MWGEPCYFNELREIRLLLEHKRSTGCHGISKLLERETGLDIPYAIDNK